VPLSKLGYDELADACWSSVAAERATGPSRCHGLAGQVDVLLDAGRVDDALAVGALLIAYAPPGDSGAERRAWLTAGLLEGNAGLAIALARLQHPEQTTWLSRVFGSARVRS